MSSVYRTIDPRRTGVTAQARGFTNFQMQSHNTLRPSYESLASNYSCTTSDDGGHTSASTSKTQTAQPAFQGSMDVEYEHGSTLPLFLQPDRSSVVRLGQRQGSQQPVLQQNPAASIQSARGSILQPSIPTAHPELYPPGMFENPRRAPQPPTVIPYDQHVRCGNNDRQPRPRRGRALSNTIRQSARRIGSLIRRQSNTERPPVDMIGGTFAGDPLAHGTIPLQEAQARQAREQEAYRRTVASRPAADDGSRYPNALRPRRPLRWAHGSVAHAEPSTEAPAPATPRRVRRLSGDTGRMTTFGAFINAGLRSDSDSDRSEPGSLLAADAERSTFHDSLEILAVRPRITVDECHDVEPPSSRDAESTADRSLPHVPLNWPDIRRRFGGDDDVDVEEPAAAIGGNSATQRTIRRKPVPQRQPNLKKPLPAEPLPAEPLPDPPRNTMRYEGIPEYAADAYGCNGNDFAGTRLDPEDVREATQRARDLRARQADAQPDDWDEDDDSEANSIASSQYMVYPNRQWGGTRRSPDSGIDESVEDHIRRQFPSTLMPESRVDLEQDARRLQRDMADPQHVLLDQKEGDDRWTIDTWQRKGHTSFVMTHHPEPGLIHSFRTRVDSGEHAQPNNDTAAALQESLDLARGGLGVNKAGVMYLLPSSNTNHYTSGGGRMRPMP